MGLYLRVAPGVKLRMTRRGARAGIGPRAARVWVGAGGTGVSTGAGPVSLYKGLHRRSRRRGPTRTSMTAYNRQVRQAHRAEEIRLAGASLRAMTTVHQHVFEPATRLQAPPVAAVDEKAIRSKLRAKGREGIPWWRPGRRRRARELADEQAPIEVAQQERRLANERRGIQASLDEEWERLQRNDAVAVMSALEEAFSDNGAPAVPIDCRGDRATVVILMEGEEEVPERVPAVTPGGRPTLRRLSKTDRNGLYRAWVYSNILATVREAFAVAPGLQGVTVVVLRREAQNPYGKRPLSVVYVGTMRRDKCDQIAWNAPAAVDAVLDADDLLVRVKGQTHSLASVDLAGRPDLEAIVGQFERLNVGADD